MLSGSRVYALTLRRPRLCHPLGRNRSVRARPLRSMRPGYLPRKGMGPSAATSNPKICSRISKGMRSPQPGSGPCSGAGAGAAAGAGADLGLALAAVARHPGNRSR